MEKVKNIEFHNQQQPDSHFDIIKLEELLRRDLDHDLTLIHKVNFYLIFLITEGEGEHVIDFNHYSYKKGTLLTIRKDQVHKFFKSNSIFELECSLAYILKMFRRYEIAYSVEYLFERWFGDFSIDCV